VDLNWPVAKLHATSFGMLHLPHGCTLRLALIKRSIGQQWRASQNTKFSSILVDLHCTPVIAYRIANQ